MLSLQNLVENATLPLALFPQWVDCNQGGPEISTPPFIPADRMGSNLLLECGNAKGLHHSLGWLWLDFHFLRIRPGEFHPHSPANVFFGMVSPCFTQKLFGEIPRRHRWKTVKQHVFFGSSLKHLPILSVRPCRTSSSCHPWLPDRRCLRSEQSKRWVKKVNYQLTNDHWNLMVVPDEVGVH